MPVEICVAVSVRGNPGPAGIGAIIVDMDTGEVLEEISQRIEDATNVFAEFQAVIIALNWAIQKKCQEVVVRLPTQAVLWGITGVCSISGYHLVPLLKEVNQLQAQLKEGLCRLTFKQIFKEDNQLAKDLARKALP